MRETPLADPERGPRLFVIHDVRKSSTLGALGLVALAGAALGVHLGQSAIAEIDPVHFRGPALHPRDRGAALDPDQFRPSPPRFAALYGWEEGGAALAADCGDCPAHRERSVYAFPEREDYVAEIRVHRGHAPDRVVQVRHYEEPETLGYETHWEEVERYAYYPVSAEEAKRLDHSE